MPSTATSSQDLHCTGSWGCALCFPTSGFFQAALPLRVELDCKNEGCSERGAPGGSSQQGRSSSLRLQQPPRDPHSRPRWRGKEGTDCPLGVPSGRLPGSRLRGDWCGWRRDRQVLACGGQPGKTRISCDRSLSALLGEGRSPSPPHPCSKEGEPLVSYSCPGHPPVPPACTGGLPADLLLPSALPGVS